MAETSKPELIDLLNDEHRALVEAGIYSVHEGADYPVLRWAHGKIRGQLVPGTGITPVHNDIAKIGAETAYRRTPEYRAMLERLIPASEDVTKRGTLAWLVSQGFNAAEGGDVRKDITCPECGHEWSAFMWKRPDSVAITKMLEMVVGRAPEQKDINVRAEAIYRFLDERQDVREIIVHAIDPNEEAARRALDEGRDDWDSDTEAGD